MKIKAYIVFLFITLSMFLVSTTYMYALPLQPTTSCSCKTKDKEEKECCFHHENQKKDCSNTCKSTVCHCSNLINIPLFFNLSFYNKKEIDFLKKEWTYLLVYPHEVYLPIWQPPKLS